MSRRELLIALEVSEREVERLKSKDPNILNMTTQEFFEWREERQEIEDTHIWLYARQNVMCTMCGVSKAIKDLKRCGE